MTAMPHICTPSHRTAWVLFAACALLPMGAQAQTAPLNDTGQTQCYAVTAATATCSLATGSQDARHGRDAAQTVGVLTKIGGGAAGFDFTALDANGAVTTNLGNHTCVYDNVTGLLWFRASFSMDWNSAMATYPSNGSNTTAPICNRTGWRLPTRRELLSIVHNGVVSNVQIDTTYFPDTYLGRPTPVLTVRSTRGPSTSRTTASIPSATAASIPPARRPNPNTFALCERGCDVAFFR